MFEIVIAYFLTFVLKLTYIVNQELLFICVHHCYLTKDIEKNISKQFVICNKSACQLNCDL